MKKCLLLYLLAGLIFSSISAQETGEGNYPYWREYHKTPVSEIKPAVWIAKDTVTSGWDWSLPEFVEPSPVSKLCIIRNFGLGTNKINNLPKVIFPANPVISHWVKWKELEPEEGKINFQPLIDNIKLASHKGYGSIVRIHFSAIDFAPDWIKKYNIPIREEQKENPQKTNYDVSNPIFHSIYLKFIKALGESGIPQMEEVQGLYLGYASPSNGDEGIGPYGEGNPEANDTVQHVIERIDAWAEACKGVEYKVYMGGLSNYGFSKGFGIRRGFVEMYLYHIPDKHIGQKLDKNNYLYVDETSPVIAKNVFQGEENEEYEEKWAEGGSSSRFGKLESFPYRYFTANLRLLQMRSNYLLNNEFALLPEMLSWVSLEMGRTIDDTPDVWCFLRESYIKENGGTPVKNFERWLHQRDAAGYKTVPAVKIQHAIKMWMVQDNKYYDYIARKGKKIGFDIDDRWTGIKDSVAIKISYFDFHPGKLNLVYNSGLQEITKTQTLVGDSVLKTATFFITKLTANSMENNFDFTLEAGENTDSITVSFVRVVHADKTTGQLGATKKVFPDNAWGVYSWFGFDHLNRENSPHIKGIPLIIKWSELEPENGNFMFEEEIGKKLQQLDKNDFNTFLMVWTAFATKNITETDTSWAFTPKWLFNSGVPMVEFQETVNPLGETTKRYFPYYFDEDYKFYFHRMIDSLGNYICNLPTNLKKRILFLQSAEGSTGDGQPYKGSPINPEYNISNEQWSKFRIETWGKYKSALTKNGELQLPLLTNYDSNEEEQYRWMLDSLPKALGLKNGMFSHGYHISDAQERLANFSTFRNAVEATGKTFFARGEQDGEWKTYGWSTQNPKQAFYWSALYATHCGLTMWNVPWEACQGETYADAITFFNRYAGETTPNTAKGAFCAFRRGLDASDTDAFPESIYGKAVKSNTQRYINIANAFSEFGANQGDPEKATGGGMVNRKRQDYNDVGWKILPTNYQRHITQIDPEETSIAWWQVDTSIYGRFARGFDAANGKDTMFFDLDDQFFGNQYLSSKQAVIVEVTYLDSDAGSWKLMYDAEGDSLKTAMKLSNTGAGGWKTKTVTLTDAYLANRGQRGSDFILINTGGTNCRFHMIAVNKTGQIEFPTEETSRSTWSNNSWQFPGDTLLAYQYDKIQNKSGVSMFALDSAKTIGIYGCNDNSGINIRSYDDAAQFKDAAQFNWDNSTQTFKKNGQWTEYSCTFTINEPWQLLLRAKNNVEANFKLTIASLQGDTVFYKDINLNSDFTILGRRNDQTDWLLSKFPLTNLWGAYIVRFNWYDNVGEPGIFGGFSFVKSNLDLTPPGWYYVSIGVLERGTNIVVMTTEDATVYLVLAGTLPDIGGIQEAAVSVADVKAFTQAKLSTAGLSPGDYVVYALDNSNNISEASRIITIQIPVNATVFQKNQHISVSYQSSGELIKVKSTIELSRIDVFNTAGKKIGSKLCSGKMDNYHTIGLLPGIYIVQVFDKIGNQTRAKIYVV